MAENVTPSGPSIGEKLLDVVIGIGAMLLLLPLAPFLLLIWLWDRLKSDERETRFKPRPRTERAR